MIPQLNTKKLRVIHKLSVILLPLQQAAKADLKSILSPSERILCSDAPAGRCSCTSALLLGLWPANPFTPWKHKQINLLCREPDNCPPPPLSLSTLVFHLLPESYPLFPPLSADRQTEALTPQLSSYTRITGPWPFTNKRKVTQVGVTLNGVSGQWARCWNDR